MNKTMPENIKNNEFMAKAFLSKISKELPGLKEVKAYRHEVDGEEMNLIITRSDENGHNVYTWIYTSDPEDDIENLKREILEDTKLVRRLVEDRDLTLHTTLTQMKSRVLFEDVSYCEDETFHLDIEAIIGKLRREMGTMKMVWDRFGESDIFEMIKKEREG